MKKNLINPKLPLLTIIYSVICVILIRHSINSNPIPYNNIKEITSETIVIPYTNSTNHSNKLISSKNLPANSTSSTTLSRGYIEDSSRVPTEEILSTNYEDDLFELNESAITDFYRIKKSSINLNTTVPIKIPLLNKHLPDYLMYKTVNVSNLKDFLKSRNSLLAEEPYLSTILLVSKNFNLNPLVMFAITGQEQSFVPKSSENAFEIANNPFNVFNSWKKYNTNIEDTSNIAARTIVNLCKNRPNNMDALTWVNRKYSEDKDWSKAVRSIFKQLEDNVAYCR
ncbi:hypothetical protein LGK97_18610 [Clostridium sp. CS001]|uniref:hypothetical protein n=1 Tax=Clostridium sp. CS001 TaxID=2880648 RepID=UPI001CF108F9|nr:hypothetical protein [Clostridium sp. CS001]MCB2291728.1 hypothetical protein [Clostridium sp. CS001]